MQNRAVILRAAGTRAGQRAARVLPVLALGLGLAAALFAPASAQFAMPGAPAGTGGIANGSHARTAPQKPQLPPPDAIPGATAREPAAPATRPAGDLQPTDALFDAINRGDIVAARDALSRGADLSGVNILGMTPLELSVDLGRNDISFLLLSMRGEDSSRGSRALARATPVPEAKPATTARTARAERRAASRGSTRAPAVAPVATKRIVTPKLFANDGGTPLPNAGFLGFDSHSASN